MKKRELIREFRQTAAAAGKPFSMANGRHGIRINCGKQSILLPPHNREVTNAHILGRRLGLNIPNLARS